jgi:aryl-alcohol dehydrogenase-like predicted oxidoreductase
MSYGSKTWRDWVLDEAAARPFIREALDGGINFFDTADVYSLGASEQVLGNILKGFAVKREDLVIATKVHSKMGEGPNEKGLSRKHIMDSIDASLKRLGTDYVDLYQIHRWDHETPIEETLAALTDLVRAGKVRYIGASSMYAWQFSHALQVSKTHGWSRFVSMQNHYNLVYREEEREMIPLCRDQGVGCIPWSPLARGMLAGNRTRDGQRHTTRAETDSFTDYLYDQPTDFDVVDAVGEIAAERDVPSAQVALAWLLSKPGVTAPIVGSTKNKHLKDALAAEELTLTEDEVERLEKPYVPHPVLGHF